MSLLVRKFNKAKWPKEDFKNAKVGDLQADVFTSCLKTSKNELSTWVIDGLEKQYISEAALALVCKAEHLATMYLVILDEDEIKKRGFQIKESQGDTYVVDLLDKHKDIVGLTYSSIGDFAKYMIENLSCRVQRYTEGDLKKLLRDAISNGRLEFNKLSIGLQNKLRPSA